jgi:cell division protein FtsB
MSNPHGVFVEFFMEAVEFKAESEKEGRPVFREIPYVRIQTPGDRNNVLEVKATDHYKQKFSREWRAFQENQTEPVSGTLLKEWPQITKSQVKEAEHFGIKTVEQLASVNDNALQRLGMGWMALRNSARTYLELASGTAAQNAQAAENDRLRGEIEALKAQFQSMADDRDEPAKRGRPRKEVMEHEPT